MVEKVSQSHDVRGFLLGLLSQEASVTSPDFPRLFLPAQLFCDRLLVGKTSGEMALKWAVFADGLRQYCRLVVDLSAETSPEFAEEEEWILADDEEWPFSFVNLCEDFGFNPQLVRSLLAAWKKAHLTPLGQDGWAKESPG